MRESRQFYTLKIYKLVKTDNKGSILEDNVDYTKTAQEP